MLVNSVHRIYDLSMNVIDGDKKGDEQGVTHVLFQQSSWRNFALNFWGVLRY